MNEAIVERRINPNKQICADSSTLKKCHWEIVILTGLAQPVLVGLSEITIASYVSIFIVLLYIFFIINKRPQFIFKYLACMFAMGANIAGCSAIELMGATWLSELQVYTSFSGSLPLLVFGWWTFLSTLYVYDSYRGIESNYKRHKKYSDKTLRVLPYLSMFVLVLCLIIFIRVLPHPSFILGIDRFEYKSLYVTGIWSTIANVLAYLIILPIITYREKGNILHLLPVIIYLLYFFWTGCKFGEYFGVACTFCFVYFDKIMRMRIDFARRAVKYATLACVIIVLFAGFAHSFTSQKSYEEFFSSRTAAQGQLWWSTFNNTSSVHPEEFFKTEIPALFNDKTATQSVGEMHGIYRIMYQSAPSSQVDSKLSTGSVYTEAGFACAYYYFGLFGVALFAILMGLLIASIVNGLLRALRDANLIRALVLLRLNTVVLSVMSMFLFSRLVTTRSLLCIAYLIIDSVFINPTKIGRRRKKSQSKDAYSQYGRGRCR